MVTDGDDDDVFGTTSNSFIVFQGMTIELWPCLSFWACGCDSGLGVIVQTLHPVGAGRQKLEIVQMWEGGRISSVVEDNQR